MRKSLLLYFCLITAFIPNIISAQKITVNSHIDSTMMWIGNQTRLSYEVSQQPGQKVIMPVFADTVVGGLELVEPVKYDTVKSPDGHLLVKQTCLVTAFEDSLLYIPAFPFVLNGDTVWSKSLSLKVVQPFQIDTTKHEIADIKKVFDAKFDWKGLIINILIGFVILLILLAGYFIVRKYILKKPVFDNKSIEPDMPAYEVALIKLDKIKQDKLWQRNRSKEYHTELTDVLREYIERTFDIGCMEMTSEEILEHLNYLRFEQKSAYLCLDQILHLADLVKFAKWEATPDEHELSLMNSYLFVNQTKVEESKSLEEIQEKDSIQE